MLEVVIYVRLVISNRLFRAIGPLPLFPAARDLIGPVVFAASCSEFDRFFNWARYVIRYTLKETFRYVTHSKSTAFRADIRLSVVLSGVGGVIKLLCACDLNPHINITATSNKVPFCSAMSTVLSLEPEL